MKTTHALYFALAVLVAAVLLVGDEKDKGLLSDVSSEGVHIAPQAIKTHEASASTEVLGSADSYVAENDDAEELDQNPDTLPEAQDVFSISPKNAGDMAERPALTVAGSPVPRPQTQYIER